MVSKYSYELPLLLKRKTIAHSNRCKQYIMGSKFNRILTPGCKRPLEMFVMLGIEMSILEVMLSYLADLLL